MGDERDFLYREEEELSPREKDESGLDLCHSKGTPAVTVPNQIVIDMVTNDGGDHHRDHH